MRRLSIVLVVAGLVACGGGDDADGPASSATSQPDTSQPDASQPDTSQPDTSHDGSAVSESETTSGAGTCKVAVTGDKTAEWAGGGTAGDVAVSYWFGEAEREMVGDGFTMILNCGTGEGNSISLLSGATADESSVPMAPGTYAMTSGGGSVGDDLFGALITLEDSETNWRITDPGGQLAITRFDDAGIAGTFEFPMEDALAELSGEASEGTILVRGDFDFPNPNS
jgi:hypothetical protein